MRNPVKGTIVNVKLPVLGHWLLTGAQTGRSGRDGTKKISDPRVAGRPQRPSRGSWIGKQARPEGAGRVGFGPIRTDKVPDSGLRCRRRCQRPASLASETAALAPRPMQLWIVALQPTCAEPSDPSIGTRWPTALVVVAITPAASHAAPGAHHTKPPAAPTRTRAPSATACSFKGRRA